jgi:hypothetical protein
MSKLLTDLVLSTHQQGTEVLANAVDTHVDATHDIAVAAIADGPAKPGTPEFCAVYTAARPVLLFARGLLFFKPKWQTVVTALIGGLDTVCPQ